MSGRHSIHTCDKRDFASSEERSRRKGHTHDQAAVTSQHVSACECRAETKALCSSSSAASARLRRCRLQHLASASQYKWMGTFAGFTIVCSAVIIELDRPWHATNNLSRCYFRSAGQKKLVCLEGWQDAGDAQRTRAACHLKHPQRLQPPLEPRRAEVHLCSHRDGLRITISVCFAVMYNSSSALLGWSQLVQQFLRAAS